MKDSTIIKKSPHCHNELETAIRRKVSLIENEICDDVAKNGGDNLHASLHIQNVLKG